eukprot:1341464-Amorphochlora_amoeboformis.AAC.1
MSGSDGARGKSERLNEILVGKRYAVVDNQYPIMQGSFIHTLWVSMELWDLKARLGGRLQLLQENPRPVAMATRTTTGWEAKWDEWITRSQIRWPKPLDHNSELEIDVGDHVEVLLESTRVPSVWMEGDVKKVTIDIDGVELFLVTGMKRPRHIWVRRDNL